MSTNDTVASPAIPTGQWRVDPERSRLAFNVKTFWGLVAVKGTFKEFEGHLTVGDAGASGSLTVTSASLDTKNGTRDKHLRSADFFDAETHPTFTFTTTEISGSGSALTVVGDLKIGEHTAHLSVPVAVERSADGELRLTAHTSVPREQVGLAWSKAGMIRGDAVLDAEVALSAA